MDRLVDIRHAQPDATPAVLRDASVLLRPLTPDDAPALLDALAESREHFFPWLRFATSLRTLDDCCDYIVRNSAGWLRGELYGYGLHDPITGRLLGGVDLIRRDRAAGRFSIGYWLRASAPHRGLMTAAVRLVTRHALDDLGVKRLEILCDARNLRSAAVARRLGFHYEGALRGINRAPDGTLATMLIFARLPSDPRAPLDAEDEDTHSRTAP